jgi:hypothetical protein
MPRIKTLYATAFLLIFIHTAHAQAPAPGPQPRDEAKGARAPRAEADPLTAQRRAQAISLLTSLADEARGFRDATLRARAQALAADALWETDTAIARTLFHRAWEEADAADREADLRLEEERRTQLTKHGGAVMSSPPRLRAEVLKLVARRDRALSEEFLSQLAKAAKQEADGTAPTSATPSGDLSPDAGQRLELAQQLLDDGDTERALQFAGPALGRVNMRAVAFLSALRERDAGGADMRYAALLSLATDDPVSDANTISLLSSYAFTPYLFFTAGRGGGVGISQIRDGVPAPELAPPLRASFLRTAAQILLRPTTPQDYDRTSAGRVGTYLIIRRLLPLFERYAPDVTAALNARAAALLSDVPERLRIGGADGEVTRGITPEAATSKDDVQEALDRAARTLGTAERDEIYANAAVKAAWSGDQRAQEIAGKIVDFDLSRRVRAFADFAAVRTALEKKDPDTALALARKGALTSLQYVWAYERAANLIAEADPARALSLLEEAAAETRRIDDEADRTRALLALATRYKKIDPPRAWEVMYEATKAANKAPDFSGEDGRLVVQFRANHGAWMTDFVVQEFDLQDVLGALASEDWNRTAQLVGNFRGEAARVTAVLALTRTALLKKPS